MRAFVLPRAFKAFELTAFWRDETMTLENNDWGDFYVYFFAIMRNESERNRWVIKFFAGTF